MPKKGSIKAALEQATAEAQKQVLSDTIAGLPAKTSLGALTEEFKGTAFADAFKSMTLGELVAAVEGGAPPKRTGQRRQGATKKATGRGPGRPKGKTFATRTQAGREAIDAAISGFLSKADNGARAEDIRGAVGGTPPQIRESLGRLISGKKVRKKGQKRSTTYTWKG